MKIVLNGKDAWDKLLQSRHSRWSNDLERFKGAAVAVAHEPKFSIGPADKFFCMGSCFARNVEEHLIYNGVDVLSRRIISPAAEWQGARANGFVNKFTTLSMLNEVDWQVDRPEINRDLFEQVGDGWRDLQLSTHTPSVALERAIERRKYLIDDYFSRMRRSDVVILTLGLNETWFDTLTGRYLNDAPSAASVRKMPERYRVEITDVDSNITALEQIYARLSTLNAGIRVIVTVSPVPMFATFSGRDAAVANTYSKTVLRVAAEALAHNHGLVDYFPSYEMVALAPRTEAYAEDCLHVSDSTVAVVIHDFLLQYTGREPISTDFNEIAYLCANPDVEAAVRRSELGSGYEHWKEFGQKEGRSKSPGPGTRLDQLRGLGV